MPLPFDMLAVMLYLGHYAQTPLHNPAPVVQALAPCVLALVVMAAFAAICNHLAVRALRRPGRSASSRRRIAGNAELAVRLAQVVLFVLALNESGLPWSLARACGVTPDAKGSHMFPVQAFGLLPYIGLFFAAWLPLYPLHKTVSYGAWTRWSFIVNKARYNLYMVMAWIPFAFVADWLSDYLFALPFLFATAAWVFPAVLAKLWGCKPLPPGETATLVARLEEQTGASFSRVFLWEPGGSVMNAAAVGLAKPFRYLFITPALQRNLSGDELAAVILHELGHVKNRHLLFYMFTTLAGINAAVLIGALTPLDSSAEQFVVTAGLILFYFRFVFGWLSRNMERQADLFALEYSGSAKNLANALEKIGIAAGNIRLAASWHHLGIAERVDFLRQAERLPALRHAHNAGVRRLKWLGYSVSVFLIAFLSLQVYEDFSRSTSQIAPVQAPEQAHWRRIGTLMPENSAARLHLAYALAGQPGGRDEAVRLAGEALALAESAEERGAAAKLLHDLGGGDGGNRPHAERQ